MGMEPGKQCPCDERRNGCNGSDIEEERKAAREPNGEAENREVGLCDALQRSATVIDEIVTYMSGAIFGPIFHRSRARELDGLPGDLLFAEG